jgi:hypothetical protein
MRSPPLVLVGGPFGYLFQHITGPLFVCFKSTRQKIGKEKHLENGKHNKQLEKNDLPQGPPQGHRGKPVAVKAKYLDRIGPDGHACLLLALLFSESDTGFIVPVYPFPYRNDNPEDDLPSSLWSNVATLPDNVNNNYHY